MGNETSYTKNEKVDFLPPKLNETKQQQQHSEVIPPVVAPKPQQTQQKPKIFQQDTRIGLMHPHLLQTLGGQQEGDQYRYFFEYCPITLQSLLQERLGTKKYFPEDDLQAMLMGIASALSFLEEKGFSHGDICASEIFFDNNSSSFKILDSSLINGRAACIFNMMAHGKFSPIAPEFYQQIVYQHPSAVLQQIPAIPEQFLLKNDIWCLGMTMLQACCLRSSEELYEGVNIRVDLINERLNEISTIYSRNILSQIAMMLNVNFEDRPDAVTLFNHLLTLLQEPTRPSSPFKPSYAPQPQYGYQQPQLQQTYPQQLPYQQYPPPAALPVPQSVPQQPQMQQQQQLQIQQQQLQAQQLLVQQQQFQYQQFQQQQLPPQQQQLPPQQQQLPLPIPPSQSSSLPSYQGLSEQQQFGYTAPQLQQQQYSAGGKYQQPPQYQQREVPVKQIVKKIVYPDGHVEYKYEQPNENEVKVVQRPSHSPSRVAEKKSYQQQQQTYDMLQPKVLANIENQIRSENRGFYDQQQNVYEMKQTSYDMKQTSYEQHDNQNIQRLKQEIEQSKMLIQQYNMKSDPYPQQSKGTESIEERIRKVIAQSQALRENFA